MRVFNLHAPKEWFEVMQTTPQAQTAAMTLAPGQATGEKAEAHEKSAQVLLVVSGELEGEIGAETARLQTGDSVVIAPGVKHRFSNPGAEPAVTFNVYIPPEYPPDAKG